MACQQVDDLREVFKCYICLEKLRNARLCPQCSKLCCYVCIRKWLTEQRSQCPHCRCSLHLNDLVICRWIEDVTDRIDRLQSLSDTNTSSQTVLDIDKCNIHQEKLSVFCWSCQACICHHCALWSGNHAGHALKPLNDEYKSKYGEIKSELKQLQRRLCHLMSLLQELDANVEAVRKGKEERVREIRSTVELIVSRLDSAMKSKVLVLTNQKQSISNEVETIVNLLQKVESTLANASQSHLIKQSGELIRSIAQIQRPSLSSLVQVSPNFISEIIPRYHSHGFVLQNFSTIRLKADPVYTSPLSVYGMSWRLKIYPDGNGVVRGQYLSVFLELTSGPTEPSKYEYRIEMIHHSGDANRNIVREFTSDFIVGECWGYNRFFKLDFLVSEGFLDEENDSLILHFQVRALTYYQESKDLQWHIENLETTQSQQQTEIERLREQLQSAIMRNETVRSIRDRDRFDMHSKGDDNFPRSSIVQIELYSDSLEDDDDWETTVMPQKADDRNGLFPYGEDNLPGQVPALDAGVDVSMNTERDVDEQPLYRDESADPNNGCHSLDFTVPDRESPAAPSEPTSRMSDVLEGSISAARQPSSNGPVSCSRRHSYGDALQTDTSNISGRTPMTDRVRRSSNLASNDHSETNWQNLRRTAKMIYRRVQVLDNVPNSDEALEGSSERVNLSASVHIGRGSQNGDDDSIGDSGSLTE